MNKMLRQVITAVGAALIAASCSSNADNNEPASVIEWETLGNEVTTDGKAQYTQRFTIVADRPFQRMAFCAFKRGYETVDPQDTLIEILPGYYAVGSSRFAGYKPGDTITVDILTRGALRSNAYRADGMHLVADGKPVRTRNIIHSMVERPEQWRDLTRDTDPMVYGDQAFAINDSLRSSSPTQPYMQIPTPKKVVLTGNTTERPVLKAEFREHGGIDWYSVEIKGDTATVYTNSKYPQAILAQLERRFDESTDKDGRLPEAIIEDSADYAYRGFMQDIVRNYVDKNEVKKTIDLMARYGLNTFHFHLGDDEGWRVEMPSLPELTQIAGHRGYTLTDDAPFLKGIYSGDGNPEATDTPANGFLTKADFIEILKYADSKGIVVIPEFDSPGHSRAAIRAMEWRARHNGDDSYRLIEDGDTSKYSSAQSFYDNIMNPAIPGPYKFWSTIFDDVKAIYAEAGIELPAVHIGGDEVAFHGWDGAPSVQALMKEKGMTSPRQVHAYFVEKVAKIAKEKEIPIAGWQEIAIGHSPEYDNAVRPGVIAVNSWTNAGSKNLDILARDYPMILTNVDYLYFDQHYSSHPEEDGLSWGGVVDEFQPFNATLDRLVPGDPAAQAKVAGISGTLFAETVRSQAMIERYILPRILGLAERAHNSRESISPSEYFARISAEMPRWAAEGRNFYVRQPGIRISDGKVEMNSAYSGLGEIRYTLDGSDPTEQSTLYTGPFDLGDTEQIRARFFMAPARSSVSILYVN